MVQLADLYDADKRRIDVDVRLIAHWHPIPHPLAGVTYADGMYDPHYETPDGIRDESHVCGPACRFGVRRRKRQRRSQALNPQN